MSKPLLQPKHEALIARLARMTGSLGGLESIMMAGQYSAPIIISLLLALAKLRDTYPRLRAGAGGKALGAGAAGASLRQLALGWGKAAESFGEWRTVSRLVGLIAMILPTIKTLYPDPLKSLLFSPIPTLQLIGLLGYYPLEHLVFFARKGVVQMDPAKVSRASIWSVRFWGLYVVAEYFKLHGQYATLKYKSYQLKKAFAVAKPAVSAAEAEGYELSQGDATGSSEKAAVATQEKPSVGGVDPDLIKRKEALQAEWAVWKDQALINTGYTPLLLHWAISGGLWTNPLITSIFGMVPVYAKLHRAWRNAA